MLQYVSMNDHIAVVGFGRLGETLAKILKVYFDISIYEIDQNRVSQAKKLGYKIITKNELANFKTVFFCVPISTLDNVVNDLSPLLSQDTLVMDTCSVKVYPVEIMRKHLPDTVSIIATHPLFGPDSISNGLEQLTVTTYPVRVEDETYQKWNDFWETLGLTVLIKSPDEHDKVTAFTLAMTHFIGRVMGELNLKPQDITTVGYDTLYKVMRQTNNDSWQLFNDMQRYNPYVKEMRQRLHKAINTIENKLEN